MTGPLYIDPGSGSYLVQLLVAGAVGVMVFFKNIRLYIRSLFYRSKKDKSPESNETHD